MPRKPSNTGPVQPSGSGPGRWNEESGSRPSTKIPHTPPRPRPTAS
ncbi:hypothetical protein [Streptomyces fradiae]|nr:hypothetical protein [Streptomyces fradiae]WOI63452.1 hypothetical protein RYQ63_28250 [Streptomyces fradiae]